ncbi:type II toxin-antitoxin system HipA family toxin [Gilvimarinus algae]|uniref:Type II toxin-antitoxin system HipA family toxin n=1 Tax=Gilvimarinus algae TaxID=3058037 RepID=A0ABT8TAE8_9GAMM|nr:type II toxin-antitoxin system HipA family toxin [Gilvimarinus sp. SDUM040014]MDO3381094.1 type II toxin-antitoxin system HipA family toxin [Gilvimarinus sp. SDUM040014]
MIAKACKVEFMGLEVGTLAQPDDAPCAMFEYSPQWLAEGFSVAPLHMPLSRAVYQFPHLPSETYRGLPAAFADSLPDDFGNALINAWLARQGLDQAQFGAIDRLLYTGTRGMGALEYQQALEPFANRAEALQMTELVHLAQQVLNQRGQVRVNAGQDHAMSHLLQVGTSAGGARPKAVIAVNADRTQILSGQVEAPPGFEHYLLKFDGVVEYRQDRETFGDPQGYGLMEYAYYLMALDCGLDMSPSELLEENGRAHFMTRRFDRERNQKYHILTLCAMAHADFKQPGAFSYEELLSVARQLNLSVEEQRQIYRRMVFNVIARNHDDHTKNTAFYVDDDLRWRLAPAYDIAYSYKPGSPWVNSHQLSINGKRDGFTRGDLLQVAKLITRFNDRQATAVIDETIAVIAQWKDYANRAGVFAPFADEIFANLRLQL